MEADLDKVMSHRKSPFKISLVTPLREITSANENEHGRHPDLTLPAPIKGHTGVKYSLDEALNDIGWYGLLEEYTKRSHTYPTDLLFAMSALAGEVQKLTKATYLAGLWALDAQIPIRSLLWYSVRPNTQRQQRISFLGLVICPWPGESSVHGLDQIRSSWCPHTVCTY